MFKKKKKKWSVVLLQPEMDQGVPVGIYDDELDDIVINAMCKYEDLATQAKENGDDIVGILITDTKFYDPGKHKGFDVEPFCGDGVQLKFLGNEIGPERMLLCANENGVLIVPLRPYMPDKLNVDLTISTPSCDGNP